MVAKIWEEALVLAPVAILLVIGLAIALRSGAGTTGTAAPADSGPRDWALNAGQTLLYTLVSVLILLAINQAIGVRLTLAW